MYLDSIEGARKHDTMSPSSGRGGNVPGTPSTTERRPVRPRMSHSRSSLTLSEVAKVMPS